jgi:hypothetical protein
MDTNNMRHKLAGVLFLLLGIYFLIPDLMPPSMGAGAAMEHEMTTHNNTLLGIGEMTWMWFTMALVHFFIRDCNCKECNK